MSVVIAIIIFSIIILFHELGHFLLAKKNGIQVNEFTLGLGPTVIGFGKGETKYCLKLLPFGGSCVMEGEDESSDNPRAFCKKGVWQRFAVVAAGPIFNFILAWFFAIIVIAVAGFDLPVIHDVVEGSPAYEAGIKPGAVIKKLDNKNIHFYREVSMYTFYHEGETIDVTYELDGVKNTVSVTPEYDEEAGRYLFGFMSTGERTGGNVLEILKYSVFEVNYWISSTLSGLKLMVTGGVSLNDVSGPVGIVRTIGDSYTESKNYGVISTILTLLNMSILLSANLGVMNLLPLPALDGGRLVFFIIEAIRGKRIDPNKEGMVHFIGLMLLLALMVVIMFNDIRQIFV